MANNGRPSLAGMMSSQSDRTERQTFFDLPANMNVFPSRLARNQRVQHQLGQVVRGVIPGAAPQPEYHPNPYLQHLYDRNNDETQARDLDIADIEAQLHEVIAQNETQADNDGGQDNNTDDENAHGHSHSRRQTQLDWKLLLGSVSFAIILLIRLMIDHILGILVFIGLSTVFYYANTNMIEIVHITSLRDSQSKRPVKLSCIWLILFLVSQIVGIYWFFSNDELLKVYMYQLPFSWQAELFDLFWVTMLTDHVVRFGTIIIKSFIAVCPLFCLPQKRKGKFYMFIEMLSQTYRMTLPVVPWLHFLYDDQKSARLVLALILSVIYIALKGWSLIIEYSKVVKAFKNLLNDTKFGTQPNLEEIKSRGENCPICQDDYQDPVMLSCKCMLKLADIQLRKTGTISETYVKHIFCENCVSIWFDREKTCPMCRAEIQADSPVWQDGSTSAHLQWY